MLSEHRRTTWQSRERWLLGTSSAHLQAEDGGGRLFKRWQLAANVQHQPDGCEEAPAVRVRNVRSREDVRNHL